MKGVPVKAIMYKAQMRASLEALFQPGKPLSKLSEDTAASGSGDT